MKIAFTTAGEDLQAALDRRFGRAPGFLVVDTATESCEYVANTQNLNAAQGAGIQSGANHCPAWGGGVGLRSCRAEGLPGPVCRRRQDLQHRGRNGW